MAIPSPEDYEDLCAEFQRQWIRLLRDTLQKHSIPASTAKEICGAFSFDLSMLFDQGEIEHKGCSYRPVVAFTDDEGDERLIVRTDGPEFHEYAFGSTDEAYEGS
jgi:hypothetical protein